MGGAQDGRWEPQHTDKVAVLEVVTVQLVARRLRIHHVLIDDEGSALGIAGNALPDLAVSTYKRRSTMKESP